MPSKSVRVLITCSCQIVAKKHNQYIVGHKHKKLIEKIQYIHTFQMQVLQTFQRGKGKLIYYIACGNPLFLKFLDNVIFPLYNLAGFNKAVFDLICQLLLPRAHVPGLIVRCIGINK